MTSSVGTRSGDTFRVINNPSNAIANNNRRCSPAVERINLIIIDSAVTTHHLQCTGPTLEKDMKTIHKVSTAPGVRVIGFRIRCILRNDGAGRRRSRLPGTPAWNTTKAALIAASPAMRSVRRRLRDLTANATAPPFATMISVRCTSATGIRGPRPIEVSLQCKTSITRRSRSRSSSHVQAAHVWAGDLHPAPRAGMNGQPEAVQLDDGSHEIETKPDARRIADLVGPVEPPQHRLALLFADAGTGVRDAHDGFARRRVPVQCQPGRLPG